MIRFILLSLVGVSVRIGQGALALSQEAVDSMQQGMLGIGQVAAVILFAGFLCLPRGSKVLAGLVGAASAILFAGAFVVWREPQVSFPVALWLSASELCLAFVAVAAIAFLARNKETQLPADAKLEQET